MKHILLVIFLVWNSLAVGQELTGKYSGFWASTDWTYTFNGRGNFEFITLGHFGNTKTKGIYIIIGDTLYLKGRPFRKGASGFERKMLIDKDSCIIDLDSRFDYCKSRNGGYLNSNKRNFKFPQTKTDNMRTIEALRIVLDSTFNNPRVIASFDVDVSPDRKLMVKPYFEVNESNFSNLKVGHRTLEFVEDNTSEYDIKFIEINQSKDRIVLKFEVKDKRVVFMMYFEYENGAWVLDYERCSDI